VELAKVIVYVPAASTIGDKVVAPQTISPPPVLQA